MTPGWARFSARIGFRISTLLLGGSVVACGPMVETPPVVVEIAVPYEVGTLDPHARDLISEFAVLSNLYEPLARTNADLTSLEPALARRWHNPSPETWVFELRPEVAFHSGKALEAIDVVATFRRLLNDSNLEIRSYLSDVLDVEAVDHETVRITTRSSSGVFLNQLNFVLIVPADATADSLETRPDGTGPFRYLEGGAEEGRLRLARHEAYWGDLPEMDEVIFRLAQAPRRAFETLLSGEVNFAQIQSRELADRLRRDEELMARFQVVSQESLFVKYLAMDMAREPTPYVEGPRNPFRDSRVRQALHLGIDREALAAALAEEAVPASQPVPRAVLGYDPTIAVARHDPGAARALLEEAGWGDGFEVVLHTRKILEHPARLVAEQLAHLGVKVQVEALEDAEFFDRFERWEMSLYLSRLGCPTGDASDVLERAFHSRSEDGALGRLNRSGYHDPELDRAIEEAMALDTVTARRDALQALLRQVMVDLPWLPLYFDREVYALERRLGWRPRADSYVLAQEIQLH